MNEREFSDAVVDVAHTFGWHVAHFGSAGTNEGWRTPVRYDGAGFPDLTLVHPVRKVMVFRELKTKSGRLRPEQVIWGEWLSGAGADWAVWRPGQWADIVAFLSDGRASSVTPLEMKGTGDGHRRGSPRPHRGSGTRSDGVRRGDGDGAALAGQREEPSGAPPQAARGDKQRGQAAGVAGGPVATDGAPG